MKLSLDWLSDFVDVTGLDVEGLAEKLTVHTAEVDELIEVTRPADRIVTAKVRSVRHLEGSARAREADVDVGGEVLTVVCAAPNVREGLVTLAALPGAVLANGRTVEAVEMHGVMSRAVLCSPQELALGPGQDGLVELPPETKPGVRLADLVAPKDTVLEIDNKSITHRPDLWNHYGFAREIAAIFGRELAPIDRVDLKPYSTLPAVDVRIESPDCLFYSAIRFGVGGLRPSPLVVQSRLGAVGSRPRNLLVDVTNYVQFEMGQPTHAFDADRVSTIVVANAKTPMELTTLDSVPRSILPGDLLIQNGGAPIALAGVIGGAFSEVTSTTRQVLLESANFRGTRVRLTAMRLGLRTDASQRFEKKLPPTLAAMAPGRILALLEKAGASPEVTSRFSTDGTADETRRPIQVAAGYISRRAGTSIDDATSKRILESIGFDTTVAQDGGLTVTVPTFRSTFDISSPDDISEEVMRLYGYDSIHAQLPVARIDSAPLNPIVRNHHRARRILAQAHGFVELKTYSWYSAQWLQTLGYTPARRTLDLRNPIGPDRRSLRDSLVPNLLAAVEQNHTQAESFRIFEIGKTFWIDAEGVKQEANQLCGLIVDQHRPVSPAAIFAAARTAVEDVARVAAMPPLRTQPGETASAPWRRTSATVDVLLHDRDVVGAMGMVPSQLSAKLLGRGHVAWFTLDIDRFAGEVYPAIPYSAPPIFPGSTQDFTFVAKPGMTHAELASILDSFAAPVTFERSFVTVYQQPGDAVRRYTFRFEIFLPDRTVTTDDINAFRSALVSHVEAHGIGLLQ